MYIGCGSGGWPKGSHPLKSSGKEVPWHSEVDGTCPVKMAKEEPKLDLYGGQGEAGNYLPQIAGGRV